MYKYLLFAFDDYYPSGGMDDCIYKFNNLDELKGYIYDISNAYLQRKDWTDEEKLNYQLNDFFVALDNLYVYDIADDKYYDYKNDLIKELTYNLKLRSVILNKMATNFLQFCENTIKIK